MALRRAERPFRRDQPGGRQLYDPAQSRFHLGLASLGCPLTWHRTHVYFGSGQVSSIPHTMIEGPVWAKGMKI